MLDGWHFRCKILNVNKGQHGQNDGAGALLNTIEFLHGCLTDPAHFKYAHPKLTIKRIKRLRKIVGPRTYCHHSQVDPACPQCQEGVRTRPLHFGSAGSGKMKIICLDHEVVALWQVARLKSPPLAASPIQMSGEIRCA
jgi:hypothetical protein